MNACFPVDDVTGDDPLLRPRGAVVRPPEMGSSPGLRHRVRNRRPQAVSVRLQHLVRQRHTLCFTVMSSLQNLMSTIE